MIGNNITLTALLGGIGESANDLDLDSAFSGAGVLTSTSALDTFLIETAGDLSLFQVSTAPGRTAFILGPQRIRNGNVAGDNVVSGSTRLFAGGDIGEEDNKLMTSVGALEGQSTGGDVWIHNTGPVTIGGVSVADGFDVSGTLEITASSPVTVAETIQAASITILAKDDDDDIGANKADDIIVKAGVTVQSTAGSVTLQAGDNLII